MHTAKLYNYSFLFDFSLGFVPEDEEVEEPKFKSPAYYFYENSKMKDRRYKFVPFYGMVPIDEEMEMKDGEEAVKSARRKREDMSAEEEPEEKSQKLTLLSPFGYVHHEPKEISYEFNPYFGYYPTLKKSEKEDEEPKEEKLYKYVPFYGFVPAEDDMAAKEGEMEEDAEVEEQPLYKYHPFRGFVPADEKEPEMKSVDDMEYKYVPVSTN